MELINPMDETLLGPKGAQPPTDRKGSSISASVSVLANTILGVALLGLPWCFSTDGLLLGLGLLIVCACLSAFGLHLLFTLANKMESRINHGGTPLTFAALAGIAHPKARYVLDFVILIKSMGVATSYLLVIGDIFPDLAKQFILTSSIAHRMGPDLLRPVCIVLIVAVFIVPASLPKRIRSMRFTNWLSVGCVLYVAVLAVILSVRNEGSVDVPPDEVSATDMFKPGSSLIHLPYPNNLTHLTQAVTWTPNGLYPHAGLLNIMTTVPVFIFAFTCHQNALSVAGELRKPSMLKINLIICLAVFISFLLYGTTAVAGYFQFGSHIQPDLLNSYDSKWRSIRFGKLLVALSVVFSFPMQCHPFRRSLSVVYSTDSYGNSNGETSIKFHRWSTALFIMLTTTIAIFVTNLGLVFELVGAVCSNTLCYIAPPLLYLRIVPAIEDTKKFRAAVGALLIVGLIVLPLSLFGIGAEIALKR
eukprot:GHVN01093772.1.p1 GENE.GHVN01093772.1~~GHVN01093772.1.p1  ORF type:complete len:475 (-),score=31.77 GHVN01093772.1:445-1869(-)